MLVTERWHRAPVVLQEHMPSFSVAMSQVHKGTIYAFCILTCGSRPQHPRIFAPYYWCHGNSNSGAKSRLLVERKAVETGVMRKHRRGTTHINSMDQAPGRDFFRKVH